MPTTDEAEIRAIIADQFAALHDRDPERMLADYTADVVQYTLAPPLQHRGVDVAAVRAWMTGFDGPIEREPKELEVTVGRRRRVRARPHRPAGHPRRAPGVRAVDAHHDRPPADRRPVARDPLPRVDAVPHGDGRRRLVPGRHRPAALIRSLTARRPPGGGRRLRGERFDDTHVGRRGDHPLHPESRPGQEIAEFLEPSVPGRLRRPASADPATCRTTARCRVLRRSPPAATGPRRAAPHGNSARSSQRGRSASRE